MFEYYKDEFKGIKISYAKEETPFGTGGGIRNAMTKCKTDDVLVFKWDSFFDVDIKHIIVIIYLSKLIMYISFKKS